MARIRLFGKSASLIREIDRIGVLIVEGILNRQFGDIKRKSIIEFLSRGLIAPQNPFVGCLGSR